MRGQRKTKLTASYLLWKTAIGNFLKGRKSMINNPKILENNFLLSVVSNNIVAWTLVKIFTAYKYVGLLI